MMLDSLQASLNGMTQVERDKFMEWLRVNHPDILREGLQSLGYLMPAMLKLSPVQQAPTNAK